MNIESMLGDFQDFLTLPILMLMFQFDMGDVLIDGKTTGKENIFMVGFFFFLLLYFVSYTLILASCMTWELLQDFVPVDVQQLLILELLCWLAQRYVFMCVCVCFSFGVDFR